MSKKLFISIAVVLGIILIALVGYYFLLQTKTTGPNGQPTGFGGLFPFGNSSNVTPTTQVGNSTTTPYVPPTNQTLDYTKKLRQISSEPVSGAGIVDTKIKLSGLATTTTVSTIRYMEKATGHIYDVELFSPNKTRVSNTTVPLSYNSIWGNSNKNVLAQFLKDDNTTVQTYIFTVNQSATTTEGSMTGFNLPSTVDSPQVLGTNLFYLEQYPSYSIGFLGSLDGTKRKQVWSSPIKELNVELVNPTTVALTTKPYPNMDGFLFLINGVTGKSTKVLGNIAGLSTLVDPSASKVVLISETSDLNMWSYDIKTQNTLNITPKTFPEKCVWSKKDINVIYCAVPNEYLDGQSLISWYMGTASFTDSIWKYDLKNNTSKIIEDLYSDSLQAIDVEKPILSDSEQYLIFVNKRDGSLWSLDLNK